MLFVCAAVCTVSEYYFHINKIWDDEVHRLLEEIRNFFCVWTAIQSFPFKDFYSIN